MATDHGWWRTQAACKGQPDVMFPGASASAAPAKAVCAGCDVRGPCLDDGLHEKHGVWGGLTEKERRVERRRRRTRAA